MKLAKYNQVDFDSITKIKEILNSLLLVDVVHEAYLFGSAVNGIMTADSDLDIVLVFQNQTDLDEVKKEIFSKRFDIAIDWIFKIKSEFEERKNLGGICFEAFHRGQKII